MGCANSKEVAAAKTPNNLAPSRSWKKRVLFPIMEGILQRRKNHRVKQAEIVGPLPIQEKADAAAVDSREEGDDSQRTQPEVIDVVALMEGLEDVDEREVATPAVSFPVVSLLESRIDGGKSGTESWTDQDESSSFCEASSPESSRNHCESPKSPRSPLFFGGARRSLKGFKRCGVTGTPDIVVSRNFSFNLRSCVDQASTPKVILDSNSPLLSSDSCDFKHRLSVHEQQPNPDSNNDYETSIVEGDDGDGDLLSAFESMLDQISLDAWIAASAEEANLSTPPKRQVILYFATDDQECSTVASILTSHGILFERKDVSSIPGAMESIVKVPALFIDGRYVGGVEQLNDLKRRGQLKFLVDSSRAVCNGCTGARLVPCLDCNGSRRFLADNGELAKCTECTEKGMVSCPLCSI